MKIEIGLIQNKFSDVEHTDRKKKIFEIRLYGRTLEGRSVGIHITDYCPFLYVGAAAATRSQKKLVHGILTEILKTNKLGGKNICSDNPVSGNDIFGFTGSMEGLDAFWKVEFETMKGLQDFQREWAKLADEKMSYNVKMRKKMLARYMGAKSPAEKERFGKMVSQLDEEGLKENTFRLYYGDVDPFEHFLHETEIKPNGWVEVEVGSRTGNAMHAVGKMRVDLEVEVSYRSIRPLPNVFHVIPARIISFDLETKGLYPVGMTRSFRALASAWLRAEKMSEWKTMAKTVGMASLRQHLAKSLLRLFGPKKAGPGIPHMALDEPISKAKIVEFLDLKLERKWRVKLLERFEEEKDVSKLDDPNEPDESDGEEEGDEEEEESDSEVTSSTFVKSIKEAVNKTTAAAAPKEEQKVEEEIKFEIVEGETMLDVLASGRGVQMDVSLSHDFFAYHWFKVFGLPKGHSITAIGNVFMTNGDLEGRRGVGFVYLEDSDMPDVTIEDVFPRMPEEQRKAWEVRNFRSEKAMLLAWKDFILLEDPDVVTGFNIVGFDFKALYERARVLGCLDKFLQLSKVVDEVCSGGGFWGGPPKLVTTEVKTSNGPRQINYIPMEGRILMDPFLFCIKEKQLPTNTLDYVSSITINDDVKRIQRHEDAQTPEVYVYCKDLKYLRVDDYIHLQVKIFHVENFGPKLCVFSIEPVEDGGGFRMRVGLVGEDRTTRFGEFLQMVQTIEDAFREKKNVTWGFAKDDLDHERMQAYYMGTPAERGIWVKYCFQDCKLPLRLFNKMDSWTGYVEMANLCLVGIDVIILRGQGKRLLSDIANQCKKNRIFLPDRPRAPFGHDGGDGKKKDKFEGATVLDAKAKIYKENDPVLVNDFASLYPSLIRAQNLCPSMKFAAENLDLELQVVKGEYSRGAETYIPHIPYFEGTDRRVKPAEIITHDRKWRVIIRDFNIYEMRRPVDRPKGKEEKVRIGTRRVYWAQPYFMHRPNQPLKPGMIPNVVGKLLSGRKEEKEKVKKYKKEGNENMAAISSGREKAIKASTNSVYGQMGSKLSLYSEKDVASSITAFGRSMIFFTLTVIEAVFKDVTFYLSEENATPPVFEVPNVGDLGASVEANEELLELYLSLLEGYTTIENQVLQIAREQFHGFFVPENSNGYLEFQAEYVKAYCANPNAEKFEITWARAFNDEDGQYLLPCPDHLKHFGTLRVQDAEHVYGDTDSVFARLGALTAGSGEPVGVTDRLYFTFWVGIMIGSLVSQYLPPPMKLEYEKTFWRFILFCKKRYVGLYMETNPHSYYIKYMGLALTRKDACGYAKDILGEAIKQLMYGTSVKDTLARVEEKIQTLHSGTVPLQNLLLTRAYKGNYLFPDRIAHAMLAIRIGKRDPANAPARGDRISFYFFVPPGYESWNKRKKLKCGHRVETPGFIEANNLQIDYQHYIEKQILSPLEQLFSLCIDEVYEYCQLPIDDLKANIAELKEKCGSNIDKFNKKREELCCRQVQKLLFNKILGAASPLAPGDEITTSKGLQKLTAAHKRKAEIEAKKTAGTRSITTFFGAAKLNT